MSGATSPAKNGFRKAAILIVLLGEEAGSALCSRLSPDRLQLVMRELVNLGPVSPEEATEVLEEYYRQVGQEGPAPGGAEYASRVLARAFGEQRAREILAQVNPEQDFSSFEWLRKAEPQQLATFMQGEHPQTIALILAHLGAKAAPALRLLPENVQTEAVKRMASLQQFSPEMVRKILSVLDRKLKAMGEQDSCSYGGVRAVADLLNRLGSESSKSILEAIEQDDPKQAVEIRNLMFTFEDLVTVPETGMREFLSQLDKKTLAMALKGASEEVRDHIFKSMSSRAVEMLKEDMDAMGPVRVKDVEQAKQDAVALVRKLEGEGKIALKSEGEEYVV